MLKQQLIDAELRLAFELSRTFAFSQIRLNYLTLPRDITTQATGGQGKITAEVTYGKAGFIDENATAMQPAVSQVQESTLRAAESSQPSSEAHANSCSYNRPIRRTNE